MKDAPPLVSVVMCTYNGSKFIDEQIASIINQDHKNIELIIVDDCSTDDTTDKVEAWSAKHPFIKLHKNEVNLGYNKNFEKALQLANGAFITLADQDDVWLPQKISASLNCFSDNEVSLAHCQNISLKDGKLNHKRSKLRVPMEGSDTRELFLYGQIPGHAMLFKRELLDKIIPMPDGILYDLWISAIATCHGKIRSVGQALVYHRVHGQNFSLDEGSPSKKKELDLHETLEALSTIEAMKPGHKKLLSQFLALIKQHNLKQYSGLDKELLVFLLKHRRSFFGHRKRFFPLVSHLKHSYKLAKMDFVGRGKL